jgi:hypothetical protein
VIESIAELFNGLLNGLLLEERGKSKSKKPLHSAGGCDIFDGLPSEVVIFM